MKFNFLKKFAVALCLIVPLAIMATGCTLVDTEARVSTVAELKDAITNAKAGDKIILDADLVIDETIVIDKNITLDLNGKTISNTQDVWSDKNWSLISITSGAEVTLDGDGKLIAKENDCYGIDLKDGSKLTINSGYINGNVHSVYVLEGTLTVNGGKFEVQQTYPTEGLEYEFVLNCYDANREAGTAKIIVYGGEFVKFNPANCSAEGAGTNFVAEGYVSTANEDGTLYTVSQQLDELEGTWTWNKWTLTFDGKGNLTVNSGYGDNTVQYTYNAATKTVTFTFGSEDYEGKYDGTYLTVSDEYGDVLSDAKFTKKAEETEETLDEIAGTWTFGDWSLTFDGKGKLSASNGATSANVDYTYNAEKKTLEFSFAGYDYSGKYDGTNLIISDEYDEILVSNKFTKKA